MAIKLNKDFTDSNIILINDSEISGGSQFRRV